MRSMSPYLRPVALAALAFAVLGVSGCKWFRKGNPDYAMSAETRPLEVPPDLTLPNTAAAMKLPQTGAQASPQGAVSSSTGFNVAGPRDEVFAKVGLALEGIDGLTIASRAQLLGSYDVSYEGASFLVRVVAVEAGTYVSAVDPRGLPAAGPAPKLIAALKAKLGS
ncbi:MAG: hypothetical protein ABIO17_10625 [Pseudoxanthomonas sp.]